MLLRRLILIAVIAHSPLDSPGDIIRDRYFYSAIGYLQAIHLLNNHLWVKLSERRRRCVFDHSYTAT